MEPQSLNNYKHNLYIIKTCESIYKPTVSYEVNNLYKF